MVSALPLAQGSKVNLFGYSSRDTVYGGSGSGDESNNATYTNTGDAAGKDVVQVYYTAPYTPGGIETSHVVLAGFGRTGTLQPGESETIIISFTYEDMASYDYTGVKAQCGAYVLEQGEYEIKLMNNSQDVIYNDANDGPRSTDGTAAVNLFDDVTWGEDVTYVSRADWAGTMPTQRAPQSREASAKIVSALTDTSVPSDPDAADITFADNGLALSDMEGLAYDDPQWDKLLEQVTVEEMTNLVANGGWCTQAVPSVDKAYYTEVDSPNGINNIMAGVTGTQYTGQSVLGCTWNQELAGRMGVTFAQETIA